jgi:hypothetical protein
MSRCVSSPVLRVPRSLAFGIGLAALAIGAGLCEPTLAANATLRGEDMPPGFGRLALTFDEPTPTRIRVANGVLVVAFGSQVKIDINKIARELPEYITMARIDPDGRGMRFALAKRYPRQSDRGRRQGLHRSPARELDRIAAGPAAGSDRRMAERLKQAEARVKEAARRPHGPRTSP